MLQSVATLVSLVIAAGALAVIVNVLADDWRLVVRALGFGHSFASARPVFAATRTRSDRRALVVRVSPQSAPRRAAA